eukprot:767936-Hanusia_phi.AAC.2
MNDGGAPACQLQEQLERRGTCLCLSPHSSPSPHGRCAVCRCLSRSSYPSLMCTKGTSAFSDLSIAT